ncbi:MAG: VWA domain-containing protein [Nannocystaceae bacterium]
MKISAVALCSVLGMGVSSASVAWVTPEPSPTASEAPSGRAASGEPDREPSVAASVAGPVAVAEPLPAVLSVPGALRLDSRLGHSALPAQGAHETFVLVEVGAPEDRAIDARAAANLSIVIDTSGSMKGKRLDNAVAAARGMVARLRPDDTVSIVTYAGRAELLLAPSAVGSLDRLVLDRTLAGLRGGGHTCISCGVDLARAQLRRRSGAVDRILLLSDGVANRGMTRTTQFRSMGDQLRSERTAVASVGVDLDYDERALFALSQASNGHHYFVEDPSGLPAVFDREARNLTGTVADRVDVDVELAEGVELLEVIARGHRRDGDRVGLSFGTFNAGDERSALLRVLVQPGRGERSVATVSLAYRDLADGRDQRAGGQLGLRLDPELSRVASLDPLVEERLGRKDALDALLGANEAFARGDVATARRELDAAQERISTRRRRSAPSAGSKVDRNFEQQLQALGGARSGFEEAVRSSPKPAAAPRSAKGKKAIRANAQSANPFG